MRCFANHCCWRCELGNAPATTLHFLSISTHPGLMQELLRKLKGQGAPDYLAVLVSMELSLHSLEVVSRLTSSLDLPQDFVNHYIANCIASCDRAEVRRFLAVPCTAVLQW